MSKILSELGYDISQRLIGYVDWSIMRDTIIDFFNDRHVKLTDTLLFYYTGHGVLDSDGEVYISTSQTDRDLPEKRGFSLDHLTKLIQKSISQRVVVLLDCCYSGLARISKGIGKNDAKMLQTSISKTLNVSHEGEGRCILAACQGLQEAFALEEQHHSLFTYYLLEGLRGEQSAIDSRGYVTADSLGEYVYNSIMSLPSARRPKQKPIRKIEASGDIILAYYPQLAKNREFEGLGNAEEFEELLHEKPIYQYSDLAKLQEARYQLEMTIQEVKYKLDHSITVHDGDKARRNYEQSLIVSLQRHQNTLDELIVNMVKEYLKQKKGSFEITECAENLRLSKTKLHEILSNLGLI